MGFWAKLFNYIPAKEREGIRLDSTYVYEVDIQKVDVSTFFKQLITLFPSGYTLYLEGTSFNQQVEEFLGSSSIEIPTKVEGSTIWPRPRIYHINLNEQNLNTLSAFADSLALPEICDHLIVYKDNQVMLAGHDFFTQEVALSPEINEEKIKTFCLSLGCSYEQVEQLN